MTVPIDSTSIKTLYIFVEIRIDSQHLHDTIRLNIPHDADELDRLISATDEDARLPAGTQISTLRHLSIEDSASQLAQQENTKRNSRLALVSTIQFSSALQKLKDDLSMDAALDYDDIPPCKHQNTVPSRGRYDPFVPRSKPLSPGEILGCTAPTLEEADAIL